MRNAAQVYGNTAQATSEPRELEAQLLMRAASKLQAVCDGEVSEQNDVLAAIRYNRRLWLIFAQSLGRPENPLPAAIKQNLANLAIFVVKHSMSLETSLAPEHNRLGVLININRELAAGLRARAA